MPQLVIVHRMNKYDEMMKYTRTTLKNINERV